MPPDKMLLSVAQRLVDERLLSAEDLASASRAAEGDGSKVLRTVIENGTVRRADALAVVASHIGVEFVDPTFGFVADPEATGLLEGRVAVSETALPIRVHEGQVVVAVPDPLDQGARDRVRRGATADVVFALGPRDALDQAVRRLYMAGGPGKEPVAMPGSGRLLAGLAEPQEVLQSETTGFHINDLLEVLIDHGGSDLHLAAGSPPQMRVNGELHQIDGFGILKPGPLRTLVYGILTARQREELENKLELDASHPVPGRGRFRVSAFFQRGSLGAVMRAIPNEIVSLEKLGMPPVVSEFTDIPRGLVLVTGATGSGKSTTLAALIDDINTRRAVHVMTVEDPIEFMHRHKMAIVNQREVGADTPSFASALRHVLRQDPDVILVGELRDLETMSTALTAAETGHLVFATLHTQDAPGSIDRVIDVFPPHQQQQVRVQLAESLAGVVTQQLLPTVDGKGRVAAVEVLVAIPAIRNMIREGKVHQIRSAMQAGGRHGMQTMDRALAALVKAGKVDLKVATERAQNVDEFMNLLGGTQR
ncbi:MAG: PilT/PilU family type 4a pilus ATPase [Acidimicrobiia bacterium]